MAIETDGMKLLETIILNEEKSAAIYNHVKSITGSHKDQIFFGELAADEERHAKMYGMILEKFKKTITEDLSEETEKYIKLLIHSNIFSKQRDFKDEIQLLLKKMNFYELAEKMERDAILYVLELQELFPSVAPAEINLILREERAHLQKVYAYKINQMRSAE